MGASYLSMQIRTDDRAGVIAFLEVAAASRPPVGFRFYVAEPINGWLAVYPAFVMEIERLAKALSRHFRCLVLLLLTADEDDFYCQFYREGKDLSFFKIGLGSRRTGKAREKLAAKLDLLSDWCAEGPRSRLLDRLADPRDVVFSSDLLRQFCECTGIANAATSFEYLDRGDRGDLTVETTLLRIPERDQA